VADLVRMAEKAQIGPYWTNGQLDGRPIPPP
jgi:FixJ family two-component response regulator